MHQNRTLKVVLVLLFVITATLGIIQIGNRLPVPIPSINTSVADKAAIRPAFSLPDLQGKVRSIDEWDGQLVVLNFWATWCGPCKEEMPHFVELQTRLSDQGVQFIGVALDNQQAVEKFIQTTPINYPLLIGGFDAIDIARDYGNTIGALPFTIIIDKKMIIQHTHLGAIDIKKLEQLLIAMGQSIPGS